MIVQVRVRSVYGNDLIYPINDIAKLLTRLTGKKTLSIGSMSVITQLGYEVEYLPQTVIQTVNQE